MEGALRDLIHAWRGLTGRPGFLVASLLTLAIGIAANVTIFSLINGIALRPMPFGDRTERLVTMHPTHRLINRGPGWGHSEISFRDLLDFRTATTVEGIGAYFTRTYVLSGDAATAERVRGGSVTPDLFPLLGIEPFLGRHFRADEAARAGPRIRRDADARLVAAALQRRRRDRRQVDCRQRSSPRGDRRTSAGSQVPGKGRDLRAVGLRPNATLGS